MIWQGLKYWYDYYGISQAQAKNLHNNNILVLNQWHKRIASCDLKTHVRSRGNTSLNTFISLVQKDIDLTVYIALTELREQKGTVYKWL